jgi:hypothetical protein
LRKVNVALMTWEALEDMSRGVGVLFHGGHAKLVSNRKTLEKLLN